VQSDVLILGAGGAGLMAGLTAGRRGRKARVLDPSPKPGGKILVSGGGRCNFSNLGADASHYRSQNPHFAKSALARFSPADFIALVQKHQIRFHEKKLGQLFCDQSAKQILDMLLSECREAGAEILSGVKAESVEKTASGFCVKADGSDFEAPSLIVATGGLSFPKLGATDFGYRLARQFHINVVATSPALDGFVFGPQEQRDFGSLAGLSLDAKVSCGGKTFQENILFTHKGLSGPACLQASLYWEESAKLSIDLLPQGADFSKLKELEPKLSFEAALARFIPKRLAERWAQVAKLAGLALGALKNAELEKLEGVLRKWEFVPTSTVGYAHAEVTRGGIDTDELSSKDMQSKKVPGLYFIGEVVDVTGELGGYNFQWAWASGHAAGSAV
jgi:predicted Rossmann fold flavoprotein